MESVSETIGKGPAPIFPPEKIFKILRWVHEKDTSSH